MHVKNITSRYESWVAKMRRFDWWGSRIGRAPDPPPLAAHRPRPTRTVPGRPRCTAARADVAAKGRGPESGGVDLSNGADDPRDLVSRTAVGYPDRGAVQQAFENANRSAEKGETWIPSCWQPGVSFQKVSWMKPTAEVMLRCQIERIPSRDEYDPSRWYDWCKDRGIEPLNGPRRGWWSEAGSYVRNSRWIVRIDGGAPTLVSDEELLDFMQPSMHNEVVTRDAD